MYASLVWRINMSEINSQILSLISEAVITARGGKIEFANSAARAILGESCVGSTVKKVLGEDIASAQASDYTASATLVGKNFILRVSKRESCTMFVLREEAKDVEIINDAFISSLCSSLNLLMSSAERCRCADSAESDPVLREALALLTKSIYVTARQISNLSLARSILSNTLGFSPRLTELSKFCREFACQGQSMLNIEIEAECPAALVCAVDTELFTALLSNLISNAFLHGKADRIKLRLIECGENVILAVTDNGVGIPADSLGTVFERHHAAFGINEMYSGSGFGLTVVRGIAGKHGGTLLLESREGQGTAVRVSLRKNLSDLSMRSAVETAPDARQLLVGLSECMSEKDFRIEYLD